MNNFPRLETDRFILRQLRLEDAKDLFQYFSLDEVTEYYDLASFVEVSQAEELIRSWNERFEKQQGFRWAICTSTDNRVMGTCGFHNWSKEHYKAEIGYELAPEFWRQGVMTEVVGQVIAFGFEQLGLNRIEAFIDPGNIASRKLLEKVGLHEEGHLKECFYEKGRFVDAVLFAVVKNDWMYSKVPL
ncbi:GNAT family N-acetyltransferase [Brevibacillus ginsengisoli]|uniref:GNAT family N-acetyltransferase n=1 Tax=Brevibacillus ginsengisoli TaxID=363854 RepID=UPI003CEA5CE8